MSEPRIVFDDRPWIVRFVSHGWVQLVVGLVLGIIFAYTLPHDGLAGASLALVLVSLLMVFPQVNRRLPYLLSRLAPTLLAVGVFAFFFFLPPSEETTDTAVNEPVLNTETVVNEPVISNSKAVQGVSRSKSSSAGGFLEALTSEESQKYSYSFSSDPEGAWLIIEGSALGQTPLTLDLPVGTWSYRLQTAAGESVRSVEGVLVVSQADSLRVSLEANP